jgi:regulator of sigma E protease
MADVIVHSFNALSHLLLGFVIPFLFVLTIVVFFHELGHFLVARWMGVKVLTFSLGFGPELLGFNDRHGTRWKISAIPLGGYVKFFGDESEASTPSSDALATMSEAEKAVSFHHQKVAPRAAIVAAGPIANFILAIVIFASLFAIFGKPSIVPEIESVEANSAAASAGFQPGDVVISINGSAIDSFADMQQIVAMNAGEKLAFVVKRGGAMVPLEATPQVREIKDEFGTHRQGILGIRRTSSPNEVLTTPVGPVTAVWLGMKETWFIVHQTGSFLGGLFRGHGGLDQVGGPIRIAQISGQAASMGLPSLIRLSALLSVSIGLLNLFPIPMLDGGHLLFYICEVVRGRPLSERAQEMGFRFGLALVLMLMVFTLYNDIVHLPGS